METVTIRVIFLFEHAEDIIINVTNLACSSHTEKYWTSVVFVRTSLNVDLGLVFPTKAPARG